MIRSLALCLVASATYGFAIGSAHSWIYAAYDLAKLPLLMFGTGIVSGLAYAVTGRFLAPELDGRLVAGSVIEQYRALAVLLLSLSPVTFFIAQIVRTRDDGRLGEYGLFLGLNALFVALCGALTLVRQAMGLLAACRIPARRAALVVVCWLSITLMVGGQVAFYLRPIFGLPATRGHVPTRFALGSEPDVRGATNFYEAMWQIVTRPALPRDWGR